LQRSWENIGLRSLFAPICSFVESRPSRPIRKIPLRKKQELQDLEKLLDKAQNGLDLTIYRPTGGFECLGSLGPINEVVNAERAYRFLRPALPPLPEDQRRFIGEIKKIIEDILQAKPYDGDKLLDFCEKVLDYLEGEYIEYVTVPQTSIP
jgi:hypothetical protein